MKSKQKTGVVHLWMPNSVLFFFFLAKFRQKEIFKIPQKKKVILEVFQSLENRKLNVKITRFLHLVFIV
jgi:hypothetical protein